MKASNSVKNRGKIMNRHLLTALLCMSVLWIIPSAADAAGGAESEATLAMLKADFPQVMLYKQGDRITRIYGTPLSSGSSAGDAAEQFRIKYSTVFGVDPDDLYPESILKDKQRTQPVMYNRETGEYKFTLVYYSQFKDGIPVYCADLRLLTRNEPGFPLVMAASALRDLGDFTVPADVAINPAMAQNAARSFNPSFINFSEPRLVIWAGIDDMEVEPTLAMEIIADNGVNTGQEFENWLVLVDARTGRILYSEDLVLNEDVTGNVSGLATKNYHAEQCDTVTSTPLPYVEVSILGGNSAYAYENGDFIIPNEGSSAVTVRSRVRGQWFTVIYAPGVPDPVGEPSDLSVTVRPPGPANFLHNDPDSEYTRAEVNAYIHANIARDFALTYNPSYPTIYEEEGFKIMVNNDNPPPCAAAYLSSVPAITFSTAGGDCPNWAFAPIVHHEYGHHLVRMGAGARGQYGEGMSDAMAVMIADTSAGGLGATGDCDEPYRDADNEIPYPCSGESHYCGQLLSGCVWETRNELAITNPDTYMDILANLAINAILLHSGNWITPEITIDYLTLDDNDLDLRNGTPHSDEILTGFGEHNMDTAVIDVYPTKITGSAFPGQPDIDTLTVSNRGAGDLVFTVSAYCVGTPQWLSVDPDGGTIVLGGDPIIIEVTMDATGLTSGIYNGSVDISSESPVDTTITIPVKFTVVSPLGGKIDGVIAGINGPIPGVRVSADDDAGNTETDITDENGAYSISLPTSTYDISFSHPDYIGATAGGVTVTDSEGISLNIEMEPISNQEIPTLSEWGMIVLALLLLSIGTIAVVRRRKAAISKAG